MQKKLNPFSPLFKASISLLFVFQANACGWYYPAENMRFSLFNADLFQQKSLRPMYYSINLQSYAGVPNNADEIALSKEWKYKLKLKSSIAEIQDYFFGGHAESEIKSLAFWKEIQQNSELKRFVIFAKSCEFNITALDPWDEKSYIERQKTLPKLMVEGEKIIQEEHNRFWKKKYAFQLLRLAFYNENKAQFHRIYHQYFGVGKEKTVLDWWATHYYSERQADFKPMRFYPDDEYRAWDEARKANTNPYSNYLHALVFRHSSNKQPISKKLYRPIYFKSQLKYAKNPEEIADLYVIKQVNNYFIDLNSIDSIVKYSPNHPHLKLILMREFNKFEEEQGDRAFDVYANEFNPYYAADYYVEKSSKVKFEYIHPQLERFKNLIESLNTWKQKNPAQYHLMLTQLNLFLHRVEDAKMHLDLVKSSNNEVLFQKHILKTCIIATSEDLSAQQIQNDVAKEMKYLLKKRNGVFESDRAMYSLCSYLSKAFESQQLNHFAGIFSYYAKTKFNENISFYSPFDYYDNKTDIRSVEKLVHIFQKKRKSALEEFCYQPFQNDYEFRILLSRMYLRTGKTNQASEVMSTIPDIYWDIEYSRAETLETSPFKIVKEIHDYENLTPMNRKQIMIKMVELEKFAKIGDRTAMIALGNAWYNFSSEGKNWHVMTYFWNADRGAFLRKTNHICMSRASQYYLKALKKNQNKEEIAFLKYMLALTARGDENLKLYRKRAAEYEKCKDTYFYEGVGCNWTKKQG